MMPIKSLINFLSPTKNTEVTNRPLPKSNTKLRVDKITALAASIKVNSPITDRFY